MPDFNFNTNQTVESLDKVPEKFRSVYEQIAEGDDAGKYAISASAKALAEAYDGTSSALDKARADKKKASDESASRRVTQKRVEEFIREQLGVEDIDEEDPINTLQDQVRNLMENAKNGKELKINLDKMKADFQKKQDEAVSAKDQEISKLRGDLFQTKVSDVGARSISAEKGSPELLLPIVEKQCKVIEDDGKYVVRVIDEQGDFRSDGKGGWMTVSDLVKEMKSDSRYAQAFESEAPSGSGSRPGSGGLPPGSTRKSGGDKSSIDKIRAGLAKRSA